MLSAALLGGCYLVQSTAGQLSLMSQREPIARVAVRASTPPALRNQLEQVTAIRNFASRALGLPDNGSYRSYADVHRPYVVWNVVAAPEFSVVPKAWCFPIVGCVTYRGYFVERRAHRFAAGLHSRGFDVSVQGVAAYSTLGHFDDPILNTMMAWDDVELAGIVFHELTHQLVYVPNDASFNEALATTVEEEGVRRWLVMQGRSVDLNAHLQQQERYLAVTALLRETRGALNGIYGSGVGPQTMRQQKQAAFAELHAAYVRLDAEWHGQAPFKAWFARDINNADLASIATYSDCVPGFERELAAAKGDLAVFFERVRNLSRLPRAERDARVCAQL